MNAPAGIIRVAVGVAVICLALAVMGQHGGKGTPTSNDAQSVISSAGSALKKQYDQCVASRPSLSTTEGRNKLILCAVPEKQRPRVRKCLKSLTKKNALKTKEDQAEWGASLAKCIDPPTITFPKKKKHP